MRAQQEAAGAPAATDAGAGADGAPRPAPAERPAR